MGFRVNLGVWNQIFAVPASAVDGHLRSASGDWFKVLLYYLRHAGEKIEVLDAARAAGCPVQEVENALHYWCGAGVLTGQVAAPPNGATAKAGLEEPMLKKETGLPQSRGSSSSLENGEPAKEDAQAQERKRKLSPSRSVPKTTVSDVLKRKEESEEVRFLLTQAENCLKKMLSSAEISTLVGLYDWAGMRVEVILMVLEYCVSLGKTNMRYIERTALDWANKGIDTHEKAEEHIREITERESNENLVKAAFGIYDRNLIQKERDYIETWFGEYGFPISMVKLAYERTVERTGKLSFPYVNSILRSWYEKGVKTPKQALEERKAPEGEPVQTSMDLEEFDRMGLLHTPRLD